MIEDLRTYLLSLGIAPVYYGFMPESSGICLYQTPGMSPDAKQQYNKPGLQVLSKFQSDELARSKAYEVMSALQSLSTVQIGNTWIVDIQAKQDPFLLKVDPALYVYYIVNYDTQIEYQLTNRVE